VTLVVKTKSGPWLIVRGDSREEMKAAIEAAESEALERVGERFSEA